MKLDNKQVNNLLNIMGPGQRGKLFSERQNWSPWSLLLIPRGRFIPSINSVVT